MMENQTDLTPEQAYSNAARMPVTARQLSDAMRAIEARREKEARSFSETITVEEAVRDLSLNATPKEIMAEIQRQQAPRRNLITAMWILVTCKILFSVHQPWLGGMAEIAFLVLAILLMRSAGRVNQINGQIVAGYWLVTLLFTIVRDLL